MKLLITKPVVLGILGTDEHATHGKPGEVVEVSKEAGQSIISVEKGVDIAKMDPKKAKELQEQIQDAYEKAEAAAEAEAEKLSRGARISTREPKVDKRDPE
jgi:uncharacterized protein involved in exopolysaccharide biosynthesis